jgi:hypothetical protein
VTQPFQICDWRLGERRGARQRRPADVRTPDFAAQEIRLECFFPTDDATAAHRW